jgi:hypothetical protein
MIDPKINAKMYAKLYQRMSIKPKDIKMGFIEG